MSTHDNSKWFPASECENFNPNRFEFVWNADYTMFRAVQLPWFDHASYIRHQADKPEADEPQADDLPQAADEPYEHPERPDLWTPHPDDILF